MELNQLTTRNQKRFENSTIPLERNPWEARKTILLTENGVSISVGKGSNVGMVRTLNEDSLVALELTNILKSVSNPFGFYMVADGMGGHEAGEEASMIAVQLIAKAIIHVLASDMTPLKSQAKSLLEKAVFMANEEISSRARARENNMGTTITLALLLHSQAFILNVGDSRTYHFSNGQLKLITQDHSLVYRLFKAGQLKYEDMAKHPQSNQILCALGDPQLKIFLTNLAEKTAHPYFFQIELEEGDGLLLCSDGLWQMVPDFLIEQILSGSQDPQDAVNRLIDLANHHGGDDNISVIYIRLTEEEKNE